MSSLSICYMSAIKTKFQPEKRVHKSRSMRRIRGVYVIIIKLRIYCNLLNQQFAYAFAVDRTATAFQYYILIYNIKLGNFSISLIIHISFSLSLFFALLQLSLFHAQLEVIAHCGKYSLFFRTFPSYIIYIRPTDTHTY